MPSAPGIDELPRVEIFAILGSGKEIQKSEKGQKDQLGSSLASDISQACQAEVWPEQVPNPLAHLLQRTSDRLRPGVADSPLKSLPSFVHEKALAGSAREAFSWSIND